MAGRAAPVDCYKASEWLSPPTHTKARREADATLPTSAEAKAALLYVYSHANTGSSLSKLGIWVM